MKKHKKLKRVASTALLLLLCAVIFAMPCLAWDAPLGYLNFVAFFSDGNTMICVLFNDGTENGRLNLYVSVDFSNDSCWSPDNWTFNTTYPNTGSITEAEARQAVNDYLESVKNGGSTTSIEVVRDNYKRFLRSLDSVIQVYKSNTFGAQILDELGYSSWDLDYMLAMADELDTINGIFNRWDTYMLVYDELCEATLQKLTQAEAEKDSYYNRGLEEGRTEGYNNGFKVGEESGYMQGYEDGQSSTDAFQNGYNRGYGEGESVGYQKGYNESQTESFNKGYNDGLTDGYNSGYSEGLLSANGELYDKGYSKGYTDGATDSGYMKNTLITIFSSPYYILNEVFDFEIFGISVVNIIMFVVSIVLVGFVIKLVI